MFLEVSVLHFFCLLLIIVHLKCIFRAIGGLYLLTKHAALMQKYLFEDYESLYDSCHHWANYCSNRNMRRSGCDALESVIQQVSLEFTSSTRCLL